MSHTNGPTSKYHTSGKKPAKDHSSARRSPSPAGTEAAKCKVKSRRKLLVVIRAQEENFSWDVDTEACHHSSLYEAQLGILRHLSPYGTVLEDRSGIPRRCWDSSDLRVRNSECGTSASGAQLDAAGCSPLSQGLPLNKP